MAWTEIGGYMTAGTYLDCVICGQRQEGEGTVVLLCDSEPVGGAKFVIGAICRECVAAGPIEAVERARASVRLQDPNDLSVDVVRALSSGVSAWIALDELEAHEADVDRPALDEAKVGLTVEDGASEARRFRRRDMWMTARAVKGPGGDNMFYSMAAPEEYEGYLENRPLRLFILADVTRVNSADTANFLRDVARRIEGDDPIKPSDFVVLPEPGSQVGPCQPESCATCRLPCEWAGEEAGDGGAVDVGQDREEKPRGGFGPRWN